MVQDISFYSEQCTLVIEFVDDSDVSSEERYRRLMDLSPSCKLVFRTLQYEGALTQAALAEETRLPSRTVRHAVKNLKDVELVDSDIYLQDARKRLYKPLPITAPDQE